MHQQEPDDLLIQLATKREKAAFTTLYDRYVERVYRYVHYRVGNQTDVEDITQEVFVRAWKAIGKYRRSGAPFSAWLLTIARNLIIDHYRTQKKKLSFENKKEIVGAVEDGPHVTSENDLTRRHINDAVAKLKGDKRAVILMRFIDGYSYAEIARILHKKEGAVRVIQYRALKDLKRILMRDQKEYEEITDNYQVHRRDTGRQTHLGRMSEEASPDS